MVALVCEGEAESKAIEQLVKPGVFVCGELRLSDGYGEFYILLKPCSRDGCKIQSDPDKPGHHDPDMCNCERCRTERRRMIVSQKDQKPIPCASCGVIISQIEPDENTEHKSLHWGQQIDYWSVEFHSWEKSVKGGTRKHHPPENYSLCTPCKEKITKKLKGGE